MKIFVFNGLIKRAEWSQETNKKMSFQKSLFIIFISILTLILGSIFIFLEIVKNEEKISAGEAKRYKSYLLADELRQSSDDLTRMARIYSVTGNPQYKEYFQRILDIRDGKAPRPVNYHNIYWDFVVATGRHPRIGDTAKSLKTLMKEAEFTETEFTLLKETEDESNQLIKLETKAMNAIAGLFEDSSGRYTIKGEADAQLARDLLHGKGYHRAKEKIMKPLARFLDAIDRRTSEEITILHEKHQRLNLFLATTMGLSILLIFVSVLLVVMSFNKKKETSGREKLAKQLAARGYTSLPGKKEKTGREKLTERLKAQHSDYPPLSLQMKQAGTAEEQPLLFFFKERFLENWPLLMAATVVIFMTLSLSWWFSKENKALAYKNTREDLASDLNATYYAVLDRLQGTSLEASLLAETISHQVSSENSLRELRDNPSHPLHQQLRKLDTSDSQIFKDYVLVDFDSVVISSNREDLIGKYFELPEDTLEQIQKFPHYQVVHFSQGDEAHELLSGNILFGASLQEKEGAVFFIVSPQTMLTKILRRGYSGDFGEIYMVNSKGQFISGNRWEERMVETGWLASAASSIVGMRVSQNPEGDLIPSVNNVVMGETGGELNEYENYLGDTVVGLWKWDNSYRFGIINEVKSKDAFAEYRSYKTQTIAGGSFTVVLILSLTLLFIWSRLRVTKVNDNLKEAYETIKQQNNKFARDLEIGSKVQMDMLPDTIKGEGFSLEAFLKPAQTVSGDFYDFSLLDGQKVYFCVGDVSGKGVPAALFMSITKTLLDKVLDQTDQTKDIMGRVNRELSTNNENCMFVTLVVGIVDLKTGETLVTNAGHNLPYIKKQNGEIVCLEKIQGPVVGVFDDIQFEQQSIRMSKGDTLLFYTDGVTDSQNIKDEFYGDERLETLLGKNEFASPKEMVRAISRNVIRFIGRAQQFDDITILSFQYSGL